MAGLLLGLVSIVALNAYAAVLIVLRARIFGTRLYRPMLVNIGLSVLPMIVALVLVVGSLAIANLLSEALTDITPWVLWLFLLTAAGIWLLFFPNSIYLITELNFTHRRSDDPVPLWYDIVSTLTLTLSGIVNAIAGLGLVQMFSVLLLDDPNHDPGWPPGVSWVVPGVVLLLGSFGVYLGRYLRLNSWDVRHPSSMLTKVRRYFGTRVSLLDAAGFVITHALLLAAMYAPAFAAGYLLLIPS